MLTLEALAHILKRKLKNRVYTFTHQIISIRNTKELGRLFRRREGGRPVLEKKSRAEIARMST